MVAAFGIFAAFAALYLADPAVYLRVIDLWSFEPQPQPFYDIEGPVTWIRCTHLGLDPISDPACGLPGRRMNYSPLWAHLPLPLGWVGEDSVPVYGLLVDFAALLGLAVLPRGKTTDTVVVLLAVVSPLSVFAFERANVDVLMFAMAALALPLLDRRGAGRLGGYATIMAAGLLKFYPWVLLGFVPLRERVATALALGIAFVGILAVFVWQFHAELGRIVDMIPRPSFSGDGFGSGQVAEGLFFAEHVYLPDTGWSTALQLVTLRLGTLLLDVVAALMALRVARSPRLAAALRDLSSREATTLAAGALLVCGCFFAGGNVGYRAIFLVFAIAGLRALARSAPDPRFAGAARFVAGAALVAMWWLPLQRLVYDTFGHIGIFDQITALPWGSSVPGYALWVARESLWWLVVTTLLGALLRMLSYGPVWRAAADRVAGD